MTNLSIQQTNLRNIAIIAHVDHGKTTLVDAMLKQTKTFAAHQAENAQTTIMDSNDLERERGVTILAKNTAVYWHEYKINILDTPGHADFSGEVERVLSMADGCVLLVDAAEGVLSQTKYVLRLALEQKLKPIVIINKVDRKDQRVKEVESEIADLFLELAVDDDQLNFPLIFARGIEGIAGTTVAENEDGSLNITDSTNLEPLFEAIIKSIPSPTGDPDAPLQMQINTLDWDDHKGIIGIGKIFNGTIHQNERVALLKEDSNTPCTATYVFVHHGLDRIDVAEAKAGEIIAVAGLKDPRIGDTVTDINNPVSLVRPPISEPTVMMQLSVNTSPFAGQDAQFSSSRQLRERLHKELLTNVGLRIEESDNGERMTIIGRGELHLGILIETMRREGYEFSLSRPEVVRKVINGVSSEPYELVVIDVPTNHSGTVTAAMGKRRGTMVNMQNMKHGVRFTFEISTANLIGYRNELLSTTSGEGVLNSTFLEFRPAQESVLMTRDGAIIAFETGKATPYSIEKAQQRGVLFIEPQESVYRGQVIGINNRSEDMTVNIAKGKKLTNMRASSADATVVLERPWKPSLEQLLTMIAPDEMLEVTPGFLRLRKKSI